MWVFNYDVRFCKKSIISKKFSVFATQTIKHFDNRKQIEKLWKYLAKISGKENEKPIKISIIFFYKLNMCHFWNFVKITNSAIRNQNFTFLNLTFPIPKSKIMIF